MYRRAWVSVWILEIDLGHIAIIYTIDSKLTVE